MEIVKICNTKLNLLEEKSRTIPILYSELIVDSTALSDFTVSKTIVVNLQKVERIKSIPHTKIIDLKSKLKVNPGLSVIYVLIQNLFEYDNFLIFDIGIDPQGVEYISDFVKMLSVSQPKKKFIHLNMEWEGQESFREQELYV